MSRDDWVRGTDWDRATQELLERSSDEPAVAVSVPANQGLELTGSRKAGVRRAGRELLRRVLDEPTRVLIAAKRTAATPALIEAVRRRAAAGPCAFTLLVPHASHGLRKLASADASASDIDESEAVLELAVPLLEEPSR